MKKRNPDTRIAAQTGSGAACGVGVFPAIRAATPVTKLVRVYLERQSTAC